MSGFISNFIIIYSALLLIYFIFGGIVSLANIKLIPHKKIQSKQSNKKFLKRDIRLSVISLFSIAVIISAGIYLREKLHWFSIDEISLISALGWFLFSMILFDTWFYWMHRLAHIQLLYKKVHRLHHTNPVPTVWTNNSETLYDNLFMQSYWLFALVFLPIPLPVLLAHKVYDQLSGMLGHAGYEYAGGRFSAWPSPMIGVTFHDQHHTAFHYNYGLHFSIWDRLMGTVHPDYDRLVKSFSN